MFPRALEARKFLYATGQEGLSTRYRVLDRYDSFYRCEEYDHQEFDWSGYPADKTEAISFNAVQPFGFTQPQSDLKVVQKKPSAPQRLCPSIVDRFTSLLFSEGRLPKVVVEDDEMTDDFLKTVIKRAHFWRTLTQARTYGGSMGSALVTVSLKEGRFTFKAHSPKMVHDIVWADVDSKTPAGVLIQYPFEQEHEEIDEKTGRPTGKVKKSLYVYRRIIDEEADLIFRPVRMNGHQIPPMEIDEQRSFQHNLGFFPGVWIQNLPDDESIDGIPDCKGAYQMFEMIDRQVSQQNRALLVNQDPTLVISRDSKLDRMGEPLMKGSDHAINVGQGGSATYIEPSASGIAASREFVKDQKQAALEKCQAIFPDPEKVSGAAQSAAAIRLLMAPTLEKASKMRVQYGEAVERLADVTLRSARAYTPGDNYTFKNSRGVFDLPPRVVQKDPNPNDQDVELETFYEVRMPGNGSMVSLSWGDYFELTPQDKNTQVDGLLKARAGELLDHETAVAKAAPIFDITDLDGLMRKLQEEREQKMKEMNQGFGLTEPGSELVPDSLEDRMARRAEELRGMEGTPGHDVDPDLASRASQAGQEAGLTEALNGAQVQAAKEIIFDVNAGALPGETAIIMLVQFFNIPEPIARALVESMPTRPVVSMAPPRSQTAVTDKTKSDRPE